MDWIVLWKNVSSTMKNQWILPSPCHWANRRLAVLSIPDNISRHGDIILLRRITPRSSAFSCRLPLVYWPFPSALSSVRCRTVSRRSWFRRTVTMKTNVNSGKRWITSPLFLCWLRIPWIYFSTMFRRTCSEIDFERSTVNRENRIDLVLQ